MAQGDLNLEEIPTRLFTHTSFIMNNFIIGVVVGVILSTVGFNGMAQIGNRAIDGIQSFATSTAK